MVKACILSISGPVLTAQEAALLAGANPWGVILMGRSCLSRTQVRHLVEAIWTATGRQTLIFIDQEGGRVARLKPPEWPAFPRAGDYAALYSRDRSTAKEAVWLGHRLIAEELSGLGVHADCAPVVDLRIPGAHDIIGDRSLGSDPEAVSDLARSALDGLAAGGVAGVIKHIPGHGRAQSDSHVDLPRITADEGALSDDFDAFARLNHAPMAMTAHVSYEALDPGRAATVSEIIIEKVVRGRIGFDGLLMTDDLGMKALGGSLAERAAASLSAGCDMLLHCSGFVSDPDAILAEMTEVAAAAPDLEGKPADRAAAAERWTQLAKPFDTALGWRRLNELMPESGAVA